MTVNLDHVLLGAPDLPSGAAAFAALTGVTPAVGGTHPGFGTRNRLVSLGADCFFEVIGPDPEQNIAASPRARMIAALPAPALLTFAVQTTDLAGLCERAVEAGLAVGPRMPMSRTRPDGVRLDWVVVRFSHPDYGEAIPFAIDWQGSPHPAGSSPGGCTLRELAVLHPEPAGLAAIYQLLGIGIPVYGALRPGFIVRLGTPKGEICFTG